jgi:hypothetical protein
MYTPTQGQGQPYPEQGQVPQGQFYPDLEDQQGGMPQQTVYGLGNRGTVDIQIKFNRLKAILDELKNYIRDNDLTDKFNAGERIQLNDRMLGKLHDARGIIDELYSAIHNNNYQDKETLFNYAREFSRFALDKQSNPNRIDSESISSGVATSNYFTRMMSEHPADMGIFLMKFALNDGVKVVDVADAFYQMSYGNNTFDETGKPAEVFITSAKDEYEKLTPTPDLKQKFFSRMIDTTMHLSGIALDPNRGFANTFQGAVVEGLGLPRNQRSLLELFVYQMDYNDSGNSKPVLPAEYLKSGFLRLFNQEFEIASQNTAVMCEAARKVINYYHAGYSDKANKILKLIFRKNHENQNFEPFLQELIQQRTGRTDAKAILDYIRRNVGEIVGITIENFEENKSFVIQTKNSDIIIDENRARQYIVERGFFGKRTRIEARPTDIMRNIRLNGYDAAGVGGQIPLGSPSVPKGEQPIQNTPPHGVGQPPQGAWGGYPQAQTPASGYPQPQEGYAPGFGPGAPGYGEQPIYPQPLFSPPPSVRLTDRSLDGQAPAPGFGGQAQAAYGQPPQGGFAQQGYAETPAPAVVDVQNRGFGEWQNQLARIILENLPEYTNYGLIKEKTTEVWAFCIAGRIISGEFGGQNQDNLWQWQNDIAVQIANNVTDNLLRNPYDPNFRVPPYQAPPSVIFTNRSPVAQTPAPGYPQPQGGYAPGFGPGAQPGYGGPAPVEPPKQQSDMWYYDKF